VPGDTMSRVYILLVTQTLLRTVNGGCRWNNVAWVQSLESAPRVNITKDHLVTVEWGKEQFKDNWECVDRFKVGIERGGIKRKLCSQQRKVGQETYQCKLDLSNPKHCGQVFTIWVSAVNTNHSRGEQVVNTYSNTVITIQCGDVSQVNKVISKSCLALLPSWLSGPSIKQIEEKLIRVEWNLTQLTHAQCVENFLLKMWEASSFSPRYTTLTFPMTDLRDTFGGKVDVLPCKSYTYSLTAVTKTKKAVDTQGELTVPCAGEAFMKSLGEEFDGRNDIDLVEGRSSGGRSIDQGERSKHVEKDLNSNNINAPLLAALNASTKNYINASQISTLSKKLILTVFYIPIFLYF